MTKKYLITGGSGFIGSAIVKRLLKEGNSVKVIDNNSRGSLSKLSDAVNVEFVQGDIRDGDIVRKTAKGIDSVVHLAYINGTEFFYSKPELVLDVALRGILNVIDACRANSIREFILASSSEVYQTPPRIPTDETVPLSIPDVLNPRYSYGGGKIISELIVINYGRSEFERVMIFRPHNVYGPDMGWEHVLPQFILRALDTIATNPEGPILFLIQGDGSQTRSFIHIDDFTDGFMCMLEKGQHLNIYNIGNSEEIAIRDVARKVVNYLGREVRIVEGQLKTGSPQRRCPDIGKLAKLGFSPRISFDLGLPSVIGWYISNAHKHEM